MKAARAEQWTIDKIYYGYWIPFLCPPPLTWEPRESWRLFTTRWRPVIRVSPCNIYVVLLNFRMGMVTSILASIWKGDIMFLIDPREPYFQIPILSELRPFLQFVVNKKINQYKAICFVLSPAPWVFTRVFVLVLKWSHQRGILLEHHHCHLQFCQDLGSGINMEKSDFEPTQRGFFFYLGMLMDTIQERMYPSDPGITRFWSTAVKCLSLPKPPTKLWRELLGHMFLLEWLFSMWDWGGVYFKGN